jgi:hypothetical protein
VFVRRYRNSLDQFPTIKINREVHSVPRLTVRDSIAQTGIKVNDYHLTLAIGNIFLLTTNFFVELDYILRAPRL